MELVKVRNLLLSLFFLATTAIVYVFFLKSSSFQNVLAWTQQHLLLYMVLLICLKTLGIVYAPLPGGLLTLGSVPLVGWQLAYTADFLGSSIGTTISYFLGKKFGLKFLKFMFDDMIINKITAIKIKKHRELEAVFVLKLLIGGSLSDALAYAAGLMKIKYRNFFIGSAISHILIGIPFFYTAGNLHQIQNIVINWVIVLVSFGILYKIKGRYFE